MEDLEARAAAARAQLGGALRECAALSRRVEGALEAWSQHSAALEQEVKALAAHPRGAAAAGEKGAGAQDSAWQELEALAKARNELRERIAEGEGEVSCCCSGRGQPGDSVGQPGATGGWPAIRAQITPQPRQGGGCGTSTGTGQQRQWLDGLAQVAGAG